jgi:hypothetical protein
MAYDHRVRELALELATKTWKPGDSAVQVVASAEAYLAFLLAQSTPASSETEGSSDGG